MILIFQRRQARRCLYWAIAILILIGLADYISFKNPPKDIYLTSLIEGQEDTVRFLGMQDKKVWVEHLDGTRGWVGRDTFLTSEKIEELREYERIRPDYGYYFTSAEAIERKCIGRPFEVVDGYYRMATEIIKNEDGRMEAKYDMIAALRPNGVFYQVQLDFNEEGICDHVVYGKEIKDRNSFLLKRLPGTQTIMSWDWLTWHVQEIFYKPNYNFFHEEHAWYVYILFIIGYAICVTIWAFAPLFLPALLLLSCHLFSFTRYIRKLMNVLTFILLIASAYVWMVAILSWGYPWLIGLPIGLIVLLMAISILLSLFDGDSKNEFLSKTDTEVLRMITPIISDMLGVDEWEVVPEARLGDDLGCDDLDFYELIMKIEEDLNILLPQRKQILKRIKTVGDLVHTIKKYN